MSSAGGGSWTAIPVPNPTHAKKNPLRVADADFVGAATGYVLDSSGRLFHTASAGRTWAEITATGIVAKDVSFSDDKNGYLNGIYAADRGGAYELRTSDGGRTWRPQRLAVGAQAPGGVLATSAGQGYALLTLVTGNAHRGLFATGLGGDAGAPSTLQLTTRYRSLTTKRLKGLGRSITVTGTLAGAQGGEQIVVSSRSASGAVRPQVVTAGANGGSFTAKFKITGTTAFVAQWAGDSGRRGAGTPALAVTVKPTPKKAPAKKKSRK
jgi:hypothetical protein